jgi:predicted nucleic-acid-binding Zn-ribbon protein
MTETPTSTTYSCPRCRHDRYEVGEIRAAGGFWSKIFDVQGRRFSTVTCLRCKHTELFQVESGKLENVFDLFTN